jgi:acetyl-CoA carboxylase carboxyltransferase component
MTQATAIATLKSNQVEADGLGGASITFPDGTMDSRTLAKQQASGMALVQRMTRILAWEQEQRNQLNDANSLTGTSSKL